MEWLEVLLKAGVVYLIVGAVLSVVVFVVALVFVLRVFRDVSRAEDDFEAFKDKHGFRKNKED